MRKFYKIIHDVNIYCSGVNIGDIVELDHNDDSKMPLFKLLNGETQWIRLIDIKRCRLSTALKFGWSKES